MKLLKYKLGAVVLFYLISLLLSFINFGSANYNSLFSFVLLALFVIHLLLFWGMLLKKNSSDHEGVYRKAYKCSVTAIIILLISALWTYYFYSGTEPSPGGFDPLGPILASIALIIILVAWGFWIKALSTRTSNIISPIIN